MSVHGEAHEGLGVSCYAWMSSPLRRYVDLVNQWQLAASLSGKRAPFRAQFRHACCPTLRAFEVVYARYDEHQREMERYWCLRWLVQENLSRRSARPPSRAKPPCASTGCRWWSGYRRCPTSTRG